MNNAVNIALYHLQSILMVVVGVIVTLMILPIEAERVNGGIMEII